MCHSQPVREGWLWVHSCAPSCEAGAKPPLHPTPLRHSTVHLEVGHVTSRLSITLFGCDLLTGTLWARSASRQCSTAKRLSSCVCLPCQGCPCVATSTSGSCSFSCLRRTRFAQVENVLLVTWDLDNLMHGGVPSHLPEASSAQLGWVRLSSLTVGNGWM